MKPPYSEPEYLMIGIIRRPHGIRGDVLLDIYTDYPERIADLEHVYLGDSYRPYTVSGARQHTKGLLLKLTDITDRDQADILRGQTVYISMDDAVPLDEGEFYLFQLTNIRVVTEDGEELGRVTDVIETGANDVYVVTDGDGGEILLPAIPEVIKDVDIDRHVMTIHLMDGLR